ncbi:uncharacterized protein KQ657_002527 [Scheffersomyces spartinae]|uniref:tRNA wybutosine-synthesizing protein 3 n=1 Tax=Scheffersomyces spartinae TaxID=45513 RepID=A0A9P8AGZ5_9ASCO|nr:uncharacterized protein KQ657_002527 [Scheffersomyces spartinae]KAG7192162.1 hypothetical protein KQ657_002527 [Scheffersomyces spartinae]
MLDAFDQKKDHILKEIGANSESHLDASPKGTIDIFCIPIINEINGNPNYVTTSSCSGRVSVFLEGIKHNEDTTAQIGAKGYEGRWVFVTHDPDELPLWYDNVKFIYQDQNYKELTPNTRYLLYKYEPLILHVKCRDTKLATALYTTAMNCGFRESGIGSNNVVAIRISIKLDVPFGYLEESLGSLVSFVTRDYLEVLTKLSDDRFKENFRKMNQLHQAIAALSLSSDGVNHLTSKQETREERRLRKMQLGLAKREEIRELKKRAKEAKEEVQ